MVTTGFQFTIETGSTLDFYDIQSDIIDVQDYNIGYSNSSKGMITISWTNAEGIDMTTDDVIFELVFTATNSGELFNNLDISSKQIASEIYDNNLEIIDLDFEITARGVLADNGFTLHQNKPNPFGQMTEISFELPSSEFGTVTIFDITGKVLTKIERTFDKGLNQVVIGRNQLNVSGVLYYKLEAGHYNASKKMILID